MFRRAACLAALTAPILIATALTMPAASAATAAPRITAVSPGQGPTAGGTRVTITGTGFNGLKGAKVNFGTTPASSVTFVSSTKVTATAPHGVVGRVNVHVVTNHGTSASNKVDGFTYVAKPTVTSVTTSTPAGTNVAWGPDTGGSQLTVTGTNFRDGMTVVFAGRTINNVTYRDDTEIDFTSPQHAPGAVNISVTSPSGTATRTGIFTYRRWWQTPTTIDASQGAPAILSCPDNQCYALDPYGNFLERTSPNDNWTNDGATISPGNSVYDLSCPADNFCAAVDDQGRALTYDGTNWMQSPVETTFLGGALVKVSCTSVDFCLAQDSYSNYTIWDGTGWTTLRQLSGAQVTASTPHPTNPVRPGQLSCAGPSDGSTATCEMVDGDGRARGFGYDATTTPGAWSGVQLTDHGRPTALSCHFNSDDLQCVLADADSNGNGRAFRFANGTWGTAKTVSVGNSLTSVSCAPGVVECYAVDSAGNYVVLGASGWTQPTTTGYAGSVLAISCNPIFCATSNQDSTTTTFDPDWDAWGPPTVLVPLHAGITTLACGDATHCFASDGGYAVLRNGRGSWGSVTDLALNGDTIASASCPTTTFCMAVTHGGEYVTDSAGTLSAASGRRARPPCRGVVCHGRLVLRGLR